MARKPQDDPKLDMTPMIDVVFELIIFFVVTIKQEDMFSKMNVNRPSPAPSNASSDSSDDITVTIEVVSGGGVGGRIFYNKSPVDVKQLDVNLREIARTSKKTPIIVKVDPASPHKGLVDVLDTCYKNELFSVSVFTM